MPTGLDFCLGLIRAIGQSRSIPEIYDVALDALQEAIGVERAAVLMFDARGVMRFEAWRGLSADYRRTVEGHSPWTPDTPDPQPIVIADVAAERSVAPLLPAFEAEGIAALAFIPLVSQSRVIGKFMVYYAAPCAPAAEEMTLASVVAAHVAFAVARLRAEEAVRRSEERLRFALDAARMGTWDWDVATQAVHWSENLERIHGLAPGTFDGTFASYEREIHPDDRTRVLGSLQRALEQGAPHDVEYRIVGPDGTVRWVEGKGRVESANGRPVWMTGVCMDITRRKEAELARLDALEEAGRLKDEFLATLSHELRTPLNAIVGWVQILQSREDLDSQTARAVEVVGRNARLQTRLIEDILDVSRIITGKLEIDCAPVIIGTLVEQAVQAVRPAALQKGLTLAAEIHPSLPPIAADPRRLQQVLGNLLSNAVKFTPERGTILVGCSARQGEVVIEVRDSGVGIAPDFLPLVFERFRQADVGTTRQYGGLGLGLAIARYLAERHGGRLEAESDGEGRGSTFRLRLPVEPSAILPADAPAPDAGGARDGSLAHARILVVDDEEDARLLIKALFEAEGAQVTCVASAEAVLERMGTGSFSVLLADIGLPKVDGFALLEQVRQRVPTLPAVAVTAYARAEDRARARAAGYNAFHTKPLDTRQLIQSVARLVGPVGTPLHSP
jgi:PAS domain S-box-containing protein